MRTTGTADHVLRQCFTSVAVRRILASLPVLLVVYAALGRFDAAHSLRTTLILTVDVGATASIVAGIVRFHPEPRAPWILLALGQAAHGISAISYLTVGPAAAGALGVATIMAHGLLVACALIAWIARAATRPDAVAGLDLGVVVVVAGFLSWVVVVAPTLSRSDLAPTTRVVLISFPLLDLVAVLLTVRIWFGARRPTPALLLLMTSVTAWFLSDVVLVVVLTRNDLGAVGLGEPLIAVALVTVAAAAQHPSMAALMEARTGSAPTSALRRALLGASMLVPPAVLITQYYRGGQTYPVEVGTACVLLSCLVMIRMGYLVMQQRSLAITDALTGLRTRRFFDETLAFGAGQNRSDPGEVGMLLVDVDHFKSVNDTYGHPVGDLVLREIAERLRRATRAGDVIARYGGEEFAILLAHADDEQIVAVAERVRASVAATPIEVDDETRLTVTVSIGVALAADGCRSPSELTLAADQRLYAAKAGGRNRVEVMTAGND